MLPGALLQPLQDHLRHVRQQHEADLKGGAGRGATAGGAGPQVPQCRPRVGLAMGISRIVPLRGPQDGHPTSSSFARIRHPKGGPRGGATGWANQACDHPRIPSFVCNPFIGGRLRRQNRPGTVRAQGCPEHDGLHPRIESWRSRSTARWTACRKPSPATAGLGRPGGRPKNRRACLGIRRKWL